jgi:hypothetical protein
MLQTAARRLGELQHGGETPYPGGPVVHTATERYSKMWLFRFWVQTALPGDGWAACAYYIDAACP